jgi:hypothetical protein
MKSPFFLGRKGVAILLLSVPLAVVGWNILPTSADDNIPPSDPVVVQPAPGADPITPPDSATNMPDGSATPEAAPVPVPAAPALTSASQELVRMAQSGVGENVMLAYVGNSDARFGLTPDQIIYLNDLGVPQAVVKGMIQRDSVLAAAIPAPPAATPPVPTEIPQPPEPVPPPTYITDQSIASQPQDMTPPGSDYESGDYGASEASSDYFNNSLSPYGSWIVIGGYGRCWRPTVCVMDRDWRPYCNGGRWIYTDAGWYWQSDYSWGWAPFHYGRWFCDSHCGWVWRADSVWSPAWVCWRQSPYYSGWAPLPPEAVFVLGRGFRFHHHAVETGFEFGLSAGHFNFVPTAHLADNGVQNHVVAPALVPHLISQSQAINNLTIQNNHVINPGINPQIVAAVSHKEIHKVFLQDFRANSGPTARPDRLDRTGATLTVFRPPVPEVPSRNVGGRNEPRTITGVPTPPVAIPRPASTAMVSGSPAPAPPVPMNPSRTYSMPTTPVRPPNTTQPLVLPGTQSRISTWQNPNRTTLLQPQDRNREAVPPVADSPSFEQRVQTPRQLQPAPGYYGAPPVAYTREPARSTYSPPEAPVPPPAPAHIAPSESYSGNRYQPAYSPPPAPAYHAPAMQSAPAYHAPPAESHSAPPPQSSNNSSSSRNH